MTEKDSDAEEDSTDKGDEDDGIQTEKDDSAHE